MAESSAERPPASVIVVIGMHRSGTSAVAQLLGSNGFDLGDRDRLVRANPFNIHGHFENVDLFTFDEDALEQLDASWSAPPNLDAVLAVVDDLAPAARRTWRDLRTTYTQGVPVLKDPRLSLLLPLWSEAFGRDALYVVCVRNPLSVARSLLARDQMDLVVGCALWEAYSVATLRGLVGLRTVFLNVDEMFAQQPLRLDAVNGVRQLAGLPAVDQIEDTIDSELTGESPSRQELAEHLTLHQLDLHANLVQLAGPPVTLDAQHDLRLSQHSSRLLRSYHENARTLGALKADLRQARDAEAARSAELDEMARQRDRDKKVHQLRHKELVGVRAELVQVTRELSETRALTASEHRSDQ